MAHAPLDLSVTLVSKEAVAEGIYRFEFAPAPGVELPPSEAGAHIKVQVPSGQERQYSLCQGSGETDRYVIVVKYEAEGKGGSRSLVDESAVGDTFAISAPVNDFPLTGNPTRYIFVAGGIGITPLYAMIQELIEAAGKPWKLYYLSRHPEQTAFLDEFELPEYRGKVVIHHTHGDPENRLDLWPVLEQPKGAYLYCCGSRGLMEEVRDMTGHWSPSSVHFEDFGSADAAHRPDDEPFSVRIQGSDEIVSVGAGQTMLEALNEHGVDVPYSCESGTCGTCRCDLLEGEADHRDLLLSDEEQERYVIPCVSRALSKELVIGLPE
ncbi:PDR/VanB family oxidoreductase [Marinobacterium lutimaris]|uniref:Phthalate 4,5-dioxygenase reductase subunit n=1 Tax=Marinobacterium lutimaris TaxID=568106 RepID=A0A1H6C4V1_9GAMM|nr:PDR/VanB family oxidoreductase [Marinobacterium lutimaris]SEG67665.1 phthalate 4,5-dioxygenase reductase subunit [Marinobacterium lutimaris]